MNLIKANLSCFDNLQSSEKGICRKNNEIYTELNRVKNNLDWQVQAKSGISSRITSLQRRVQRQQEKLEAYERLILTAGDLFNEKDSSIGRETRNIMYELNACKFTAVSAMRNRSAVTNQSLTFYNGIKQIGELFGNRFNDIVSLNIFR